MCLTWRIILLTSFTVVNSYFSQSNAQTCDNWLKLGNQPSYFSIGELDVPGTTITVEATYHRTAPYHENHYLYAGDLVSKHLDPTNVNYLLRPNSAEITTENGYFATPEVCEFELHKTYHVALTYDGQVLKFYRNGFLMSQINATGNLYQNDFETRVGLYDDGEDLEQMIGYVNEVRIWNTVRSQAEIRSYMNKSLPSPTTQKGLLAYYTFDNLKNKQGNSALDGFLSGDAVINSKVPDCPITIDSCECSETINVLPVTPICADEAAQLNVEGAVSFSWSPASTLSSTTIANPVASPKTSTTYYLNAVTPMGCNLFDSAVVVVKPSPVLTISNDATICENGSVQLNVSGARSYVWDNSSGTLSNANSSSPTAKPSTTTKYTVEGTGNNGCISSASVNVKVNPPPNFTITEPTTICLDGKVQLIATGGDQYQWSPTPTLSNSSISNPIAMPKANQSYSVKIINTICQVTKTLNTTITVKAAPKLSLTTTKTEVCNGETAVLGVSGADTYKWGNAAYIVKDANTDHPEIRPTSSTYFYVTGTENVSKCTKQDSILIKVNQLPILTTRPDTTICEATRINLYASGAQSYQWQDASGVENPIAQNTFALVSSSTNYKVTGTDAKGCRSVAEINISVIAKPVISISEDQSVCEGEMVRLNATGGDSYIWGPSSGFADPDNISQAFVATSTTEYSVRIVDETCRIDTTLYSTVNVLDRPQISISERGGNNPCVGGFVTLEATGGNSFVWTPADGLDNSTSNIVNASPSTPTFYKVTSLNSNGCSATDSIFVTAMEKNYGLYILPNAFTPNNDGLNDCFGIKYWGLLKSFSFTIFNRFGQQVFRTTKAGECWDGSFKNKMQESGSFVYFIEAESDCAGRINKKGSVLLIR